MYSKSSLNIIDRLWETATLSEMRYNKTNFTMANGHKQELVPRASHQVLML